MHFSMCWPISSNLVRIREWPFTGVKILPVHNLRNMMGCNGTPVGNSCRTVLISSGIAAVRISLGMADKDRHITVIHILIHKNRVSPVCHSQINHVFIILAVMADDLVGIPEFVEQLLPRISRISFFRTSGDEGRWSRSAGYPFFLPHRVQFLKDQRNGNLPVSRGLKPSLYNIRENNDHLGTLVG